ncbi:MAG: N-acetyltransferase [marine bacterium B5-7]|nr:MAG: N-acetyltransferase [marine bacterium B5-7]
MADYPTNTEPTIDIRSTRNDDIEQIQQIYADAVLHTTASFELIPPDTEEMLHRFQDVVAHGHPHLVACQNDNVLGYCYASAFKSRPGYRHTVECSVYVHNDMRRQGVAVRLLESLINQCRQRQVHRMIAVIGDVANTASIRLHEKLDFTHAGVLTEVGFKFDRWIDVVLMERVLSPV